MRKNSRGLAASGWLLISAALVACGGGESAEVTPGAGGATAGGAGGSGGSAGKAGGGGAGAGAGGSAGSGGSGSAGAAGSGAVGGSAGGSAGVAGAAGVSGASGQAGSAGLSGASGHAGAAGGPSVDGAVAGCDHTQASEAELLAAAKQALATIAQQRQGVWQGVFGLKADGTVGPGTLAGLDWDPSHDSVTFGLSDPERVTPLLLPNDAGKTSTVPTAPLAVAGDTGKARYVVFGANPLHDLARTTEPGGGGNAAMGSLVEASIRWLTGNTAADGAGLNIAVAHLPDSYWFKHDATTHSWLAKRFPAATVNAPDACESAKLGGCLAAANLLVIGQDTGSEDDHGVPYDEPAVLAAVEDAQQKGVPVVYLQYDGTLTALGSRLMSYFRLSTSDNYWDQARLKGFSPDALTKPDPTLAAYSQMVETLAAGSLTYASYAGCVGAVNTVPDCQAAAFRENLGDGLDAVRAAVGVLDEGATPLCSQDGLRLLKLLVLLGDKYRAGDAQRAPLAYPVDFKNDAPALARAAFADASVCYRRPTNPAQVALGTFVCPRSEVLAGACQAYDPAAVTLTSGAVSNAFREGSEWTSTGYYAVRGRSFTVKRTDAAAGRVAIRLNPQRVGSTRSLQEDSGVSNYDRPQFLASPWMHLEPGQSAVISTPYGGSIYMRLEGSPGLVGQAATLELSDVAQHPAVLDIGDPALVAGFLQSVQANPLPFVDIRGDGFEAHLRKDKFLNGASTTNYSGDLALLFADYRDNFVAQVYSLAGLRIPGKTLDETLSADVKAVCAANGWACLDDSLHVRQTIQHANYDQYAACGYGCSGNPFDAGWDLDPIGWGDSHELGHNLQRSELNIGWAEEAQRNSWKAYENRAGENSNNIFPYHTRWHYERFVRNNQGELKDDHMNHRDFFAVAQSDAAGLMSTVGGAVRKVIYDGACSLVGDFDAVSSKNRGAAVWSDDSYAADNGLRMSFYLALPLMLDGKTLPGGVVLQDGFDLFTLLYLQARLFHRAAGADDTWTAQRDALGFASFPRTGDATYGDGSVGDITGNDFLLVALSYLTGLDFRPYFESRGVRTSNLARDQVQAHRDAGRVKADAPTDVPVLDTTLPGKDLSAVDWVALDGVSTWPLDGWHPSKCDP